MSEIPGRATGEATPEGRPWAATLEVVEGPHRGLRFEFRRPRRFLVGRGDGVDLQLLEDPFFSRKHFVLEVEPPRCMLRDLGSSGGTYVDGERVASRELRGGELISGGRTRLRFLVEGRPTAVVGASTDGPTRTFASTTVDGDFRGSPPGLEAWSDPAADAVGAATLEAPSELPPEAPGYEILRRLGVGGMGEVYLARQVYTGSLFALKLILPESAGQELARRRFLREISVLCRLDHPRIVRFHEVGVCRGRFYFAMDYVEAIVLRRLLDSQGPAARARTACGLAAQALEGLGYAHGLGYVHRDIKPSNILVGREGGRLAARLSDFGLAKNFHAAGFSAISRDDQAVGTPAYMAPEQAINARYAAPAVDLYGLGATLYAWLTGRTPHDLDGVRDALRVVRDRDPVPLLDRCPELPSGLADVVHRALARSPADRFPTAEAMRAALAPYVDEEAGEP